MFGFGERAMAEDTEDAEDTYRHKHRHSNRYSVAHAGLSDDWLKVVSEEHRLAIYRHAIQATQSHHWRPQTDAAPESSNAGPVGAYPNAHLDFIVSHGPYLGPGTTHTTSIYNFAGPSPGAFDIASTYHYAISPFGEALGGDNDPRVKRTIKAIAEDRRLYVSNIPCNAHFEDVKKFFGGSYAM